MFEDLTGKPGEPLRPVRTRIDHDTAAVIADFRRTTMWQYAPVLVVAALIGAAALLTRTRLGRRFDDRIDRREPQRLQDPIYALLRREVQVVGRELEALPYERLREWDDSLAHIARVVDGVQIHFSTELVSIEKNGDLHVCIDAYADAPEWKWRDVLPSYNFRKRKDGSVY